MKTFFPHVAPALVAFCICSIAACNAQVDPTTQSASTETASTETAANETAATESASSLLGIGSKAPALDIEHWISDGNGFFKPVTQFEKGKVYVVEFWATWCGPCVMSMPHLAELQNKYRGENVQLISVSDEGLDEVEVFLKRKSPNSDKTFAEVTAAYSLATDPDGSVYKDYMDASNQQGIPTAFVVGKSGEIEWIGHPMEMDEPLDLVVNDTWDREAFKKQLEARQRLQESIERISMLAGTGKFDEAIKLLESEIAATDDAALAENLKDFRYSLMLSAGKVDEETIAYYRAQIKQMGDDPIELGRFAYSLVAVMQQGGKAGPLVDDAIKALSPNVEKADAEDQPFIYNILAKLAVADDKSEQAIEFQKKAVATSSDEQQKDRMQTYLDQLIEQSK